MKLLFPGIPLLSAFLLFMIMPLHSQNEAAPASNQFAFDNLNLLLAKQGNIVFSPFSAWTALTMTSAGAGGTTLTEMDQTLCIKDPAGIHAQAGLWSKELNSSKGIELKTANRLWADSLLVPLESFKKLVERDYAGGFETVNFAQNKEAARQQINAWVSQQTADRINHLLAPNNITSDTRLILTNAIYFKATWQKEFNPESTRPGTFTLPDGSKVEKEMMRYTASLPYFENSAYQAVQLNYVGGDTSMIVVLPFGKNLPPSLDAEKFATLRSQLKTETIALQLPRFTLEERLEMVPLLKSLGMKAAFTDSADFTQMAKGPSMIIGAVIHQAFVKVGEKGTEAAAATAVAMLAGSAYNPVQPKAFIADHPFLFFIVHNPTGGILFAGRVDNP